MELCSDLRSLPRLKASSSPCPCQPTHPAGQPPAVGAAGAALPRGRRRPRARRRRGRGAAARGGRGAQPARCLPGQHWAGAGGGGRRVRGSTKMLGWGRATWQARSALVTPPPACQPNRLRLCRSWVGEEPGLPAPLEDPEHCFNSFYKKASARREGGAGEGSAPESQLSPRAGARRLTLSAHCPAAHALAAGRRGCLEAQAGPPAVRHPSHPAQQEPCCLLVARHVMRRASRRACPALNRTPSELSLAVSRARCSVCL